MIKISDLAVGSCENVSPDWPSPIRVLRCLRNIVSNGTHDSVTLTLSDDKPEDLSCESALFRSFRVSAVQAERCLFRLFR